MSKTIKTMIDEQANYLKELLEKMPDSILKSKGDLNLIKPNMSRPIEAMKTVQENINKILKKFEDKHNYPESGPK